MLTWKEFNKNTDFEYICKNRATRQRMYQNYLKEEKMKSAPTPIVSNTSPFGLTVCTGQTYCLGTCEAAPPKTEFDWWSQKQEGINPMNYATATVQAGTTETQDQRKYLTNRLQDVYSDKRDPLEAAFGLTDDEAPRGPLELAERLKDGKFTVRYLSEDTHPDAYRYWHWTDLIQWRDPAAKRDEDGFKKAVEELKTLRQAALDTIKIDEPKAGLDAIKALEAWTPTGAAN